MEMRNKQIGLVNQWQVELNLHEMKTIREINYNIVDH